MKGRAVRPVSCTPSNAGFPRPPPKIDYVTAHQRHRGGGTVCDAKVMIPTTSTFSMKYDPAQALLLQRLGKNDPTMRIGDGWILKACHTPDGPGTIELNGDGQEMHARGWGPGAGWLVERAELLCGSQDDPDQLQPRHAWLAEIIRSHPRQALGRAPKIFDVVTAYVLQQRVKFVEAANSWRRLVHHLSIPAPGPHELWLAPTPTQWRGLGLASFRKFGVDEQRARTMLGVATHHRKLDRLDEASLEEARTFLPKVPGIGPWTSAMVLAVARGDPDAVPVGDTWMPSIVEQAFGGGRLADDTRMLAHLQPYAGQRYRVLRLLFAAGFGRASVLSGSLAR